MTCPRALWLTAISPCQAVRKFAVFDHVFQKMMFARALPLGLQGVKLYQ